MNHNIILLYLVDENSAQGFSEKWSRVSLFRYILIITLCYIYFYLRYVNLLAEEEEDLWHAFNLIRVGDIIQSKTLRFTPFIHIHPYSFMFTFITLCPVG